MSFESKEKLPTDVERGQDLNDIKPEYPIDSDQGSLEAPTAQEPKSEPPPQQQTPTPFNLNANFPEGGTRGWLTVAGCWCVMLFTFGYLNAFGIYETYYLETFMKDHTPSDVAWIGSIQIFAQFSGSLFSGPICDRWGPLVSSSHPFPFSHSTHVPGLFAPFSKHVTDEDP